MLSKIFDETDLFHLDNLMERKGARREAITDRDRISFLQSLIFKTDYDLIIKAMEERYERMTLESTY
jgi:hypothetical protein